NAPSSRSGEGGAGIAIERTGNRIPLPHRRTAMQRTRYVAAGGLALLVLAGAVVALVDSGRSPSTNVRKATSADNATVARGAAGTGGGTASSSQSSSSASPSQSSSPAPASPAPAPGPAPSPVPAPS